MRPVFVLVALIAAVLAVSATAQLSTEQYQFLFTRFIQQHNKVYESNDVTTKFATFKSNVDLILAHNARGEQETFKMGINQFTDMTSIEFHQAIGLRTRSKSTPKSTTITTINEDINTILTRYTKDQLQDTNVDWRSSGMVSPIKSAQNCAGSWSFAATDAIESHAAIKSHKLSTYSVQQLIDCSVSNQGCDGGKTIPAYQDIQSTIGGLCLDTDYPYVAKQQTCQKTCSPAVKISGFKQLNGDAEILDAIEIGPVSIGLDASSTTFQFYQSGIVTRVEEAPKGINFNALIVGKAYKFDNDLYIYIIKLPFGTSFGESGYMRTAAKKKVFLIGTSDDDSYPIIQ